MAGSILQQTNPTLLDVLSATGVDGKYLVIGEVLRQATPILDDMTVVEGNLPNGNECSIRTGLPKGTWRRYYGGTQPSKGTQAKVFDRCGMLSAISEVDRDLANRANNLNAFRAQEDAAHIQGMSNTLAAAMFYDDETDTEDSITGLAPRYNDLSAKNADNIINAGGTGTDNRSIWLVGWSPNTVFSIYPKGSVGGLQMFDYGQQPHVESDGSIYQVYRSEYKWDIGVCVKDWRYAVRICNIDKSALTADASSGADLPSLMLDAWARLPETNTIRPVFYMDRYTRTMYWHQMSNGVKNSTLTFMDVGGHAALTFQGTTPVHCVDALNTDETLVS